MASCVSTQRAASASLTVIWWRWNVIMLTVIRCRFILFSVLSGCLFLNTLFPPFHPPSLTLLINLLYLHFYLFFLNSNPASIVIFCPPPRPAADVWQVFPGIVGDSRCQPCLLWTDGGSLPVWRGSQCRSDPGYLSAGPGLPGWNTLNKMSMIVLFKKRQLMHDAH